MATLKIRGIETTDFAVWQLLWDGYNAFYGPHGETALAPEITQVTWQSFFDPAKPYTPWWQSLTGNCWDWPTTCITEAPPVLNSPVTCKTCSSTQSCAARALGAR